MRKIIFCLIGLAIIVFCACMGNKIPLASHINIYNTLLTISGILFGILGIWVSVLYPEILAKTLSSEVQGGNSEKSNQLLAPMFFSLLVFMLTGALLLSIPFILALKLPLEYCVILKHTSSGIMGILFVSFIYLIFNVMASADALQSLVRRHETIADMKNRSVSGSIIPKSK